MKLLKSLTAAHLAYSILILGVLLFLKKSSFEYLHTSIYGIFVFFLIQGLIISAVTDWVKKNASDKLSFVLLGSVVFRLLTALMGSVIVLILGVSNKQVFIINFFTIYFVNLIFEMSCLVANLRPNSGSR